MERDVILKIDDYKNLTAKTSFTSDELDIAVDAVREQYEDPQDSEKLLNDLEQKGYIKITGSAPEILDLYL